jgi:hypothetical protein
VIALHAAPVPAQDSGPGYSSVPSVVADDSTITGCGKATNIGSGNEAPLYIDGLPCIPQDFPYYDTAYTNIKICAPGSTANCQVIDHVIVDSGSDGVRVASSAIKSALLKAMPYVTSGGKVLTECETYVDSYTYGPIKKADIYIGGKSAKNFPLQIFGVPGFPTPGSCSSQGGASTNTPASFGGNGLVGVAFDLTDYSLYYNCAGNGTGCVLNTTYAGIPNLVSKFSSDNNGVVMTFPAVSTSGSGPTVMGSLIFGVGTKSNNKPPSKTTALLNDDNGEFNLVLGTNKVKAYIDSGTDDLVINGPYAMCAGGSAGDGYYCPSANTAVSMGVSSYNKSAVAYHVGYTVGNATKLLLKNDVAYNDLAEPAGSSSAAGFDYALGLSTFFGRTMYFVFEGRNSSLGAGPINAMSPQK